AAGLDDEMDPGRHDVAELNVRERQGSVGIGHRDRADGVAVERDQRRVEALGDDRRDGLRKRRSCEGRNDEHSYDDKNARRALIHGTHTPPSVISSPRSMIAKASRSCSSVMQSGGLVKRLFQLMKA